MSVQVNEFELKYNNLYFHKKKTFRIFRGQIYIGLIKNNPFLKGNRNNNFVINHNVALPEYDLEFGVAAAFDMLYNEESFTVINY